MRRLSLQYLILCASVFVLSVLAVTIYPAHGTDQVQFQPTLTGTASTSDSSGPPGTQAQSGSAKIFIEEPLVDFGLVPEGSEVSHTFTVRNNGDAPLKLIKAKGT